MQWPPDPKVRWSAGALVVANLVPLVGVLALGWELGDVILLFWAENAVIGAYTILKLVAKGQAQSIALVPFFVVHYGMFMTVHLAFVLAFFVVGLEPGLLGPGAWASAFNALSVVGPALVALVVSHGVSFVVHFLRGGERERSSAREIMMSPYRRVMVLHLTILGGGFATLLADGALAALILLVGLKAATDLVAHAKTHRGPADPTSPAPKHGAGGPPRPAASSLPETPSWRPHQSKRG